MSSQRTHELESAVARLEARLDADFRAGRYREFFQEAHALRERLKAAPLGQAERERLWTRLRRCTDAAKERQQREFEARATAHHARWREQLAAAERYAAALEREIEELAARSGPPAERALWRQRIREKESRLRDVRANVERLRARI